MTDLDRRLRVGTVAEPGPDVTEKVLAAVRLPRRRLLLRAARVGLAIAGVAQLGIGVTSLFGPVGMHMAMSAGAHMNHEEAAFNLAFAVGLLLAAARPRWAGTQVPVLAGFVLVLAVASVFDLADGAVGWLRLATHAPIVAGLVLAGVVARLVPRTGPAGAAARPRRAIEQAPVVEESSRAGEGPDHRLPPPAARSNEARRRSA